MNYILQTNSLTKKYKNFQALNGLTMNVPKGSIYGFVGKNGAGKTTLIRLICGLQEPTSGSFSLYGIRNDSKDIIKSRRRMGAVVATASSSSLGQQVVDYAKQYLGCPYVYGGNGPSSFDCSGYTSYVYRHFGYTLNRTASTQLSNGTSVSKSELQPGDLVFFKYNTSKAASHVGIYIGGGQFIHASTNTYTVKIDDLTRGHYANVYVGARRIL